MSAEKPVVKDYMIPLTRYPHLKDTQTILDATQSLLSYTCGENNRLRYSELVVINSDNQLIGILNLQSILKGLDHRLAAVGKMDKFEGKGSDFPNLAILWEDSFFAACSKKTSSPVKELAILPKTTVKAGDSILKALSIMLYTSDYILPVIDNGIVSGVIRLEEIFKAICKFCKPDNSSEESQGGAS